MAKKGTMYSGVCPLKKNSYKSRKSTTSTMKNKAERCSQPLPFSAANEKYRPITENSTSSTLIMLQHICDLGCFQPSVYDYLKLPLLM